MCVSPGLQKNSYGSWQEWRSEPGSCPSPAPVLSLLWANQQSFRSASASVPEELLRQMDKRFCSRCSGLLRNSRPLSW